jgi:ATP-binding cassette subfamily F protein uup
VGTGRNPRRLVEARGIAKSYGDRCVFRDLDLFLGPGSRVGLIGPNGCGKSTLLRVLVGQEAPDAGSILRADGLEVAFFEQHREVLDPALTVVDTLCPGGDHITFRGARVHVSGYLARFLFRAEHHNLKVGQLSGGEQSRLALARLMLRPANLLVLDEPTNDLDLVTLEVLEESLLGFDGAVLLVTHDRYFLDRATTKLLAFHTAPGEQGRITPLAGLGQWEIWYADQIAATANGAVKVMPAVATSAPRRKLSYKDQRDFDTIEARIAEAEARLAALHAEQASPEVASNAGRLVELESAIAEAKAEIDALYRRWSELEALLPS